MKMMSRLPLIKVKLIFLNGLMHDRRFAVETLEICVRMAPVNTGV